MIFGRPVLPPDVGAFQRSAIASGELAVAQRRVGLEAHRHAGAAGDAVGVDADHDP
jgi:hypothetical protein